METVSISLSKRSIAFRSFACLIAIVSLSLGSESNEELKSGDTLVFCGDSITEARIYAGIVELYLKVTQPLEDLKVWNVGQSYETTPRFNGRMEKEILIYRPTAATVCYGMNDAGSQKGNANITARYKKHIAESIQKLKQNGVRYIVIGSPGVVDSDTYDLRGNPNVMAVEYNASLASLAAAAREAAKEAGVRYAPVHEVMADAMRKAKAKYGKGYHVAGSDGVHPAANGHLLMAYAFLKGLGVDGKIATISYDMANGVASATGGTKVLSSDKTGIKLESTRYPFCFSSQSPGLESPSDPRGMLEFIPFHEELNRYDLVVTGAPSKRLRVTWGEESKEFSAETLEKGVNLAAEFPVNPFSEPVEKQRSAVNNKQSFQTEVVRTLIRSANEVLQTMPEAEAESERLRKAVIDFSLVMRKKEPGKPGPVQHSISISSLD